MNQLTRTEKSFFKIAQSLSTMSDHRVKIGCVVVNKHRIISSGHNSNSKCHAIQAQIDMKHFNCFCSGKVHAETSALIPLLKSNEEYNRATLYTYREYNDGRLAMARPCPRCMELIKKVGITTIKYTTDEGYAVEYLGR